MTPWVAIQRNPKSGSGPKRRRILDLIARLRQLGIRPRLFSDRRRLENRLADPASRESLLCLVAAGGDGTVADVVNRFPGLPMTTFPLGTENLFARHFKIPRSGHEVAGMIAAGHTIRIDLGLAGPRRFTLMASCGFDADVIHRLHDFRTGHIRRATYLKPILHSLRKYRYPPLRVYADGAQNPEIARLVLAANLPGYAIGLRPASTAVPDDGSLDLRLFRNGSGFQMIRYVYKVARGTHERLPDIRSCRARHLRIESDEPVPLQIDGDPAGFTPVEISVLPAALEIIVPGPRTG